MKLRPRKKLLVVDDDLLGEVLQQLGLLDDLLAGQLKCERCKRQLSMDSVGSISQKDSIIVLYCNSEDCAPPIRSEMQSLGGLTPQERL